MLSIPITLTCPICGAPLTAQEHTLQCTGAGEKQHSYDIAASGYVNLLSPGKKNNAKTGDSKEMVRARSAFLHTGAYECAAGVLAGMIGEELGDTPAVLLDAGCGEGYYTLYIAAHCPHLSVIGFDASKYAAEAAAKAARRAMLQDRAFFAAGNIFSLPVATASCDLVLNGFAPEAHAEFRRILKTGGTLFVVSAGERHLYELKQLLYGDAARYNVPLSDAQAIVGFTLQRAVTVRYERTLTTSEDIRNLFAMTPYFHRTSRADSEHLNGVDRLCITVDFDIRIYHKND